MTQLSATQRQSFRGRAHALWVLVVVLMAAALTMPTKAQPAVATQFDMVGFIQQATVDRPGDIFSGGTLTVNNVKIIVPYYTILQMPAFALTWQELFAKAPAPYTGLQTGLALQDVPKPAYTYEVNVVGNRLPDGTHIAGLLFISQQSLHSGQGWITAINFATGEVTVDGTTRVKPNDPLGRFSVGFPGGSSPDARFTIDEDNPTVRASSSYPMCIPRSSGDALCPQKNRPLSPVDGVTHLGLFTMPFAGATPTPAGVPDPYLMAPFEVGDFVTYNGILAADAGGTYVLAHTLIAEATILTAPGTQPAYTAIDVLLMGTISKLAAPGGIEGAVRTRVEGWSTDGSGQTAQNVYAVDVDACSGNPTERLWNDRDPKTGVIINGPFSVAIDNLVALGRWRFRPSAKDESFLPAVRMLMARNTSLSAIDRPVIVTPNGLRAGEYTAPVFEFIMPEANPPGGAPPPPNPFENIPFLVSGEGPYNGGAVTGQLSPWPGLVRPVSTTTCAAAPPPPPPPPPPGTLAPVAVGDTLAITGTTLSFSAAQLLANDTGSGISLVAVSPLSVGGGTITGAGPFLFTPRAGFTTSDSFTYEITDTFGQTAIGVVTVVRSATVSVPNVVGLTQAAATTAITGVGLTVGTTSNANSAAVPSGSIISQAPVGGTSAAPGTAIALVVSIGPLQVAVPNVVGQTQAAASTAITGVGLVVGTITSASSATVPNGSVISQAPAGGVLLAVGSAVALTVSTGPALVTVPNVVGQTQTAASTAITGVGLVVGAITSASSATVPSGSVISQAPAGGVLLAVGSAVALTVSTGPAPVTVPNVVGQTQTAASTAITGAGLVVGTITNANSATVAAGSVISQSPASGTSVPRGSAVALTVSLGPVPVSVPSVVGLTQTAATTAITGSGLIVGTITNVTSATVPAGLVISQSPAGGASVAAGSAVALTVSLGPAATIVPNVVGLTQTAATTSITGAGLVVGTTTSANSATVAAGSVISQNPLSGTAVGAGSAVALVISLGPAAGNPTVQVTVSADGTGPRTTPAFSTTTPGEVLIALIGSDGPPAGVNTQTLTVTGAGLTWTRVQRAAASRGVSEIWTATAPTVLTGVTVTSTQAVPTVNGAAVNQSITVVAFTNATAVGATTAASNVSTNATANLVAQAAGSVVYGVGNDFDRAITRTAGAGQTKIHEFLAPTGDTFWMQSLNAATAAAGATVTLNATIPTPADQWNFAIVEIKR